MNYYITGLGSQISEIRNLLGWTQEELAGKIGISRSSIVKIENDPTSMKKYIAFSLYLVVRDEVRRRKNEAKGIDFNKKTEEIIKQLKEKVGITSKLVSSSALYNGLGVVLAGMAVSLFKNDHPNLEKDKIKEITDKTIKKIEVELAHYFGLNDLMNTDEFMKKIKGEE
ncbi:MAG: helix-turn-helix domain-containing protein [bacterium]